MIFRRRARTPAAAGEAAGAASTTSAGEAIDADAAPKTGAGAEPGAAQDTGPEADHTVIDLRDDPADPTFGTGAPGEAEALHEALVSTGSAGVAVDTAVDTGVESLVVRLTEDLASASNGIEFIYRSLEQVAGRTHADDAVLVVENDDLGRQAFRANRQPIDSSWGRDVVRSAPAGLHLLGAAVDDRAAASVSHLSTLALRLDVATHDSLHDSLTNLLNRRSFDDHLETACSQSERYGWRFALVLIDLDNFKAVNDRLGHQAGDTILRAVGAELRSGLRAGDAAARVGGDEFALILPNADEALLPSLLHRLQAAVRDALPGAAVGLSAGLALAPEDGTDMGSLFRMADQRLYEAKAG